MANPEVTRREQTRGDVETWSAETCRVNGAPTTRSERGRTLDSMAATRTRTLGPAARPVAVPADLGDDSQAKAHGRVRLPLHVRWSGPTISYDLGRRADRARVYEQVLREGTEEDVRFYVHEEQLLELWDELVLPPSVRHAWASWIEDRRGS